LGLIYLKQGKTEQAITEFLEEIKHHPYNSKAYYNLGYVYENQKQFADAIIQYQRVLEISPNFGIARDNINNIYLKQGKLYKTH
jgi:tetratricopeptide (TPR) repeat protein